MLLENKKNESKPVLGESRKVSWKQGCTGKETEERKIKEETEGWKGVNQVKRGKVLYARGRVYAKAQKSEGLVTFWGAESWVQLEYED